MNKHLIKKTKVDSQIFYFICNNYINGTVVYKISNNNM